MFTVALKNQLLGNIFNKIDVRHVTDKLKTLQKSKVPKYMKRHTTLLA